MHHTTRLDAAEIAADAAEAIRELNHGTHPADGWPGLEHPSDVYRTLAALARLADRLPQALGQVSAYLSRELHLEHLAVEGGEHADDPKCAVGTVVALLEGRAASAARRLADALDDAQQAIAFVSYTGPDVNDRW